MVDEGRTRPSAASEPVAWRIMCTNNGATGYLYTEALPFEPGPGVNVRREPEPLYSHLPQASSAASELAQDIAAERERLAGRITPSVWRLMDRAIALLNEPQPAPVSAEPWRIEVGYKGSGPWDRTTIETGNIVVATVNTLMNGDEAVASARLLVERANAATSSMTRPQKK